MVDADIEVFKKLDQLGIHLIAQMVPNDKTELYESFNQIGGMIHGYSMVANLNY